MAYEIIPQNLSITAMRSSGYRDSAHAIAELIDNSIQAGETLKNQTTEVEVICLDRVQFVNERNRSRAEQIAVYDNACGMDAETLRIALQFGNGTHLDPNSQDGIGKFGMGLPNASISQCRKVEVWTWQDGKILYAYLDVDEIVSGRMKEVPKPELRTLPKEWLKLFRNKPIDHGTLVVWSDLDRINWKQSGTLLKNAEFVVGRIYRYFIARGRARIRLAAYEATGHTFTNVLDDNVRPNDPLYLMASTSMPEPYDSKAAFDEYGSPDVIKFSRGKNTYAVTIRYSMCKPEVREIGGGSEIGTIIKKNQGVSVVRADRELEMNHSFEIGYDPRERWWGIEVSFGPGLDDLFGVTNNKQSATNFYMMDKEDDAAAEGLTVAQYQELLEDSDDPRRLMYDISDKIRSRLRDMREQIARFREGSRKAKSGAPGRESAEGLATVATRQRREKLGKLGRSDADEGMDPDKRAAELESELQAEGLPSGKAKELAQSYINTNLKFLFQTNDIPGSAIFDVRSKAGTIIITLNRRHPAHEHLFELLKDSSDDPAKPDTPALIGLKLLLTAWARMEDEASDKKRQDLEDLRIEWGKIARDFMNVERDS